MNFDKLDNPAWHSLNETHSSFAIGNEEIKFYHPGICPFGGINSKHPDLISFLEQHSELNSFFFIGDKPIQGNPFGQTSSIPTIEQELVCLQMILSASIQLSITEDIVYLNNDFKDQLTDLVNLVQPGYFNKYTSLMGDYFGIFWKDQLVAVTGERMKMFGFTEISAVVTHPEFTGRGYAKQLVAYTANKNFEKNITPYLHVADTNTNAITLYEKLGFITRRKMSFWKMKRITG